MKYRITVQTENPLKIDEYSFDDRAIAKSIARILARIPHVGVIIEVMREDSLGRLVIEEIEF